MFADTILGMGRTSIFESAIDNEIEAITPDTVEECAGDPFEFLTGAYYESELNMMHINQAVMVCEYTYLKENGTEMVYEANVVSNMFSKIGSKIKEAWKKICAFFKSIFNWLDGVIKNDKKFVDKYKDKISEISSVNIGEFKGYSYGTFTEISTTSSLVGNKGKNALNHLSEQAKDVDKCTGETKVEDYLNDLRAKTVEKKDGVTASNFGEELAKFFRGAEVTQSTFDNSDLKKMLSVISTTKVTKADLDICYKSAKGTINTLLSVAKSQEKAANVKAEKKDSEDAKAWHVRATILNSMVGMCTMINNKACKAITAHNRQCRAIITKAVAKAGKSDNKDGKKATSESASFVESVFDSFLG